MVLSLKGKYFQGMLKISCWMYSRLYIILRANNFLFYLLPIVTLWRILIFNFKSILICISTPLFLALHSHPPMKIYFYFMGVGVLPTCLCTMCMQCPCRPEEDGIVPEIRVIGGCVLQCFCSALEEQTNFPSLVSCNYDNKIRRADFYVFSARYFLTILFFWQIYNVDVSIL